LGFNSAFKGLKLLKKYIRSGVHKIYPLARHEMKFKNFKIPPIFYVLKKTETPKLGWPRVLTLGDELLYKYSTKSREMPC